MSRGLERERFEEATPMDLLEHQGKEFLAAAGIAVSPGTVARSVDEAVVAAASVGWPAVLKAQVRAGGRGKAGGIAVVGDATEAAAHAERILALTIGGLPVRRLWVEPACAIAAEWYLSVTFDRATRGHLVMLSARGGMDIEALARDEPEALARMAVDPARGVTAADAALLVERAGLGDSSDGSNLGADLAELIGRVFAAYQEGDAELVEINPLVVTTAGKLLALDAKVTLDDNAAFRHPEWAPWTEDDETLDERDRDARSHGLNYVGLDGSVGVIGNGAGLVMSTLDVVAAAGGRAANFLDIGGGASAAVMTAALKVVDGDDSVRAILVNIFGGITRGEEVAGGILGALSELELRSPIVVRLDGTNATEGRALLAGHLSDRLVSRPTMTEAAECAVALAAGRQPQ